MLAAVYLGLKTRLESIPNVEEIDYYLGQYLQGDRGGVLYTNEALFIEFLPISWESLRNKVQKAVLTFRIHAVSACLYDDEERMLGTGVLDHMALVSQVFQKMQGFRIIDVSERVLLESIVRTQEEPDHELEVVMATVQEFQATIFDYSAMNPTTRLNNIDLVVTTKIKSIQ